MRVPYVIDNQTYRLRDISVQLLAGHSGRSLDVATAYFNVQGFRLLKAGLDQLGSCRDEGQPWKVRLVLAEGGPYGPVTSTDALECQFP
jgi:hypothetical protein